MSIRPAPPARRREPSMEDVAREAGVSGQTVSRVVNDRGYVGAATREKVTAAMTRLGYRPNSAARALRSGRFRTLGVIMFTLTTYGNHRTLDAIAARAAHAGYSLTLLPVDQTDRSTVGGAFGRLEEHAVDGIIILIEAHELDGSELEIPQGMPIVVIDSNKRYQHPFVDVDQAQGARLAVAHLLDLGHETVHHIAGPPQSYSAERRQSAWRTLLEESGCRVPAPQVGDWSAKSGYEAGCALREDPTVTAVFAANDEMAIGAMRAFHEAGLRVPEDISVVGFDDVPDSAYAWPPLTTVRQNFDRVGRDAVDSLLAELDGEDPVEHGLIPTELIVRASAAAPRGAAAGARG